INISWPTLSAGDLIAQEAKYHVQCLVSLYNKARQAKLVSYLEDAHTDTEAVRVFKLADLTRMYTTKLEQLGTNADIDTIHLARASSIVRRDMYKMETSFTGTFDSQCQESSVPNSLVALVSMILYGPNVITQSSYSSVPQGTLTLTQLLMFNCFVCCREGSSNTPRHGQKRERPFPVYLSLLFHTKTRKQDSSSHIIEGPFTVLEYLYFSILVLRELDFSASTESSHSTSKQGLAKLPQSYTNVPPVTLCKKDPVPPKLQGTNKSEYSTCLSYIQSQSLLVINSGRQHCAQLRFSSSDNTDPPPAS
ncbi:hypothetical protein Hamer_G003222, partial [Homarus americanus]